MRGVEVIREIGWNVRGLERVKREKEKMRDFGCDDERVFLEVLDEEFEEKRIGRINSEKVREIQFEIGIGRREVIRRERRIWINEK